MTPQTLQAEFVLNYAIVNKLLPELYYLLDEALIYENKPLPKQTKLQIKKALPAWCTQSFEYK